MAARQDGGGTGRKGDKIIRDALMAVQRNEPDRLKRIAEAWWKAAETDQVARTALADRLDGKPTQQLDLGGIDGEPIRTSLAIEFINTISEEAAEPVPTEAL